RSAPADQPRYCYRQRKAQQECAFSFSSLYGMHLVLPVAGHDTLMTLTPQVPIRDGHSSILRTKGLRGVLLREASCPVWLKVLTTSAEPVPGALPNYRKP